MVVVGCTEADIAFLLVEPLRERNYITFVIVGDRIKEFPVIRSILICIPLTIIIAPFVNIVTIPPDVINVNFLFYNPTFFPILQSYVMFRISTTRSHPVTITDRILLDVSIYGTIDLNLSAIAIDCIRKILNGFSCVLIPHSLSDRRS